MSTMIPLAQQNTKTIMVAGRDWRFRGQLSTRLLSRGHQVIEAVNDQHALAVLEECGANIDLLLFTLEGDNSDQSLPSWATHAARVPVMVLLPGLKLSADESAQAAVRGHDGQSSHDLLGSLERVIAGGMLKGGVLILHGEDWIRRRISDLTARAGFAVMQAASGSEAFRRIAFRRPEILVVEVSTPDLHSLELLQQLRDAVPDGKIAAVCSGWYSEAGLITARAFGADLTLFEPSPEAMLEAIGELSCIHPIKHLAGYDSKLLCCR